MNKKKNYIKPLATVYHCNTESLLASQSTGGENNTGGPEQKPGSGGSTDNSGSFGSKENSGLMDWDDEEW